VNAEIAIGLWWWDLGDASELKETTFRIVRRSTQKGAAQFWWMCHLPATEYPLKAFSMADPSLRACDKSTRFEELQSHSCTDCLGTYGADLQRWILVRSKEVPLQKVMSETVAGLQCAAKVTPIAGFIIENFHAETLKDIGSSRRLGVPLGAAELCATQTLRRNAHAI
jgi:hypothetical protein